MSDRYTIEIDDVHLSLGRQPARVHILRGISIKVAPGEAIGLVGQSGSGKSTLLMALAGLERIDSGAIKAADSRIDQMGEDELARFRCANIGIVFQSFHLIQSMTALENVAIPLELAGRRDALVAAADELRAVGLGNRLSHYPAQLSGGEQQRVALARALAPSPAILLADEPTGNLDERTGAEAIDLIFKMQQSHKTTMILVTHDAIIAQRCDRILRMKSGKIAPASAERQAVVEF